MHRAEFRVLAEANYFASDHVPDSNPLPSVVVVVSAHCGRIRDHLAVGTRNELAERTGPDVCPVAESLDWCRRGDGVSRQRLHSKITRFEQARFGVRGSREGRGGDGCFWLRHIVQWDDTVTTNGERWIRRCWFNNDSDWLGRRSFPATTHATDQPDEHQRKKCSRHERPAPCLSGWALNVTPSRV